MNKVDLKNTAIVMFGLLLATLTGFLRQSAIAYTLGVGRATDTFLVAYAIPEFVFFALPIVLTPVILPLFSRMRLQSGEMAAWSWGFRLSTRVVWLIIILLSIVALTAPVLISWLSPGFSMKERQEASTLMYRMLPGLLFMGLSTISGVFLQIYRHFILPALTTAVYNLVFIAGILWLPQVEALSRTGWSVTIAAFTAFLFQLPMLIKIRQGVIRKGEYANLKQGNLNEAYRLLGWMAAGYGVHHLILFIDRAMATSLGEGIAALLNFGYHPTLIIIQISGLAVSYVLFPTLVESIGTGQMDEMGRLLRLSLGFVLAIALPLSTGMIILRTPFVRFLLERGAFTPQFTEEVGTILSIYAFGSIMDALCQPLWRLVYASRSGWEVFAVNSVQTILRIGGNILLILLIGFKGIAWSAVFGLSIQLILLGGIANLRYRFIVGRSGWKTAGKLLLAMIISGLVAWVLDTWVGNQFPNFPYFLRMVAVMAVLLSSYAMMVFPLLKQTQCRQNALRHGE